MIGVDAKMKRVEMKTIIIKSISLECFNIKFTSNMMANIYIDNNTNVEIILRIH